MINDSDKKTGNDQEQRKVSILAASWNIIGSMLASSGLGYFIGWKLQDPATGAFVGGLIGLFYCGYEIWKAVRKPNG